MKRLMLSMVVSVAALGLGFSFEDGQKDPPLRRFEYSQIHMGVAVHLTLYAESDSQAESAAKAVFTRFAELEQVMSDYRPTSEISQLCRTAIYGPVKVSEDLYRVLRRSLDVAKLSGGAFDPTVGPLVALWREARKTGALPKPEDIRKAKRRVGWQFVDLDDKGRTVFLRKHNLMVDFGGIAKGDACDQTMMVLSQQGIRRAMVEAGGDLKVSDPPPGKPGWRIEIQGIKEAIILKNRALSTSGSSEQFVEIGGKRYSHIVDPETGLGLTNQIQASVLASSGLTTDPLATMVCVLGPKGSRRILDRYGARMAVVTAPNEEPTASHPR